MSWIRYAAATSVALATADVCVKLAAGRISNSLGLLLYGACTFATGLGWVLVQRLQGAAFRAEPAGALAHAGQGLDVREPAAADVHDRLVVQHQAGPSGPASASHPAARSGHTAVSS